MVRHIAVALAFSFALAVPTAALACAAHQKADQQAVKIKAKPAGLQLAQAGEVKAPDVKLEAVKDEAATASAQTGAPNQAATTAKKAKPKAKALSAPKAAETK